MTGNLSSLLKATAGISRVRLTQGLIDEIENDPVLSGQCEYEGDTMFFRGVPVEVMTSRPPAYKGGKAVNFVVYPGYTGVWKIDNGVPK